MFSKALFKQSCKANGTMWAIITFAVCFMLACVMLIGGNGGISETKNSIQDTIIVKEIDAELEKRAINYYVRSLDGMQQFDAYFAQNVAQSLAYHKLFSAWFNGAPNQEDYGSQEEYAAAVSAWQNKVPKPSAQSELLYAKNFSDWQQSQPKESDFASRQEYLQAVSVWNEKRPVTLENAVVSAYTVSCGDVQEYVFQQALAINPSYTEESTEYLEMLGTVMYIINPNGMFNEFYTSHGEDIPSEYDVLSIASNVALGKSDYIKSEKRIEYLKNRAENGAGIFLAGNMTEQENVDRIINELSGFGISKEKYDSFGYGYSSLKHTASVTVINYRNRYEYETKLLQDKYINVENPDNEGYASAVKQKNEEIIAEIAESLLSSLPADVAAALEEVGKADLYTLVVGSIFYKLAGLLLPIIYVIMASNNLIAGQVDSGSMAYVLSTSTKRITVVFTQAVYLLGSLLAMFCLTTVTGCICLAIVIDEVSLTYGKLILLNVGAFFVMIAISGLCFMTSCWFDRSKRSMAIGGGLSIFSLVAAMLGLFGSPVIPSVVRLDALNNFNYTTVISLFDVVSVIEGSTAFIWKFAILIVLGIAGYIIGSAKFVKKDLPL